MKRIEFPKDFIFGVGNSAYQSEGAWNEDGKGESIWDRYCHTPGNVVDGESGDVASDFYHRYPEDIALMKQLGLRHFRLSVAWSRVIPDGSGEVNPKGIAFYHKLLDELAAAGIEPLLTISWWDLPQKLQDRGGWANRETVEHYERYARLLFGEFGGKVKRWVTFAEPFCVAFIGNFIGSYAPALKDFSTALQVSYHLLLAHGRAVAACREMLPEAKIGISLNLSDCKPATGAPEDAEAALRADGYRNRWFLDPLYKARFPQDMLDWYTAKGVVLPDIRPEDLAVMATPTDFLAIDFYSPHFFVHRPAVWPVGAAAVQAGHPVNDINWEIVPEALFNILERVKREYGDIEMMITENGSCATDLPNRNGEVLDDERIDYMYRHLIQLHRARTAGIRVTGYYAFSFTDNLEWALGFTKRFGLVYVDFKTQQRIVKQSGRWYSQVALDGGFALAGQIGQ